MNILFVCIGNTCRSPYLTYAMQTVDNVNKYDSCGIDVKSDTMSNNLKKYFDENEIVFNNKPKNISKLLFECADLIFAVDDYVYEKIISQFGNCNKVVSLNSILGVSVTDPYGKSYESYLEMISVINKLVPKIITYINK